MRALSSREQRLLAIGLLMCVVVGTWQLLIQPLVDGFAERSETRADLLGAFALNDRILAGLPVWRMEAEHQAQTAARFTISAPTTNVGSEYLVQRISRTVRAAGGAVLSTQVIYADLPQHWIGVQSDLQLTVSQLNAVLTHIQNEEPYVVVDFLSIGINPPRQLGGAESLTVRIAISAPLHISTPAVGPGTVARHA